MASIWEASRHFKFENRRTYNRVGNNKHIEDQIVFTFVCKVSNLLTNDHDEDQGGTSSTILQTDRGFFQFMRIFVVLQGESEASCRR